MTVFKHPQAAAETMTTKATPPPTPPPPTRKILVRPFDARRNDAQAILHMCRDVYGGTDYMPRVIGYLGELSAREDQEDQQRTIVLVAEEEQDAAESADTDSAQVGVVVAQLRGEGHAFLFGLRVDSRVRGRGVGRVLMRAAVDAAAASGAQHLVGATIPSNAASIALFLGTGHREHARVDVWPPFPLLAAYEREVGFSPPPGQRPLGEEEQGARYRGGDASSCSSTPTVRLIDHLGPEVRGVLVEAAAGAAEAAAEPRRCSCVDELERALAEVRRQAQADDDAPSPPPQWVPAMYEVMPARGPWARERAKEGGAWLLPSTTATTTTEEAVVVAGHSMEARRFVVGVVAVDGDAAARALLFAERLAPGGHFLAFVDVAGAGGSGGGRRRGGGDGGALSRLYQLTRVPDTHPEGKGCMIVYHREAV
jgi:GNAT superfamily N-acetyltransferase